MKFKSYRERIYEINYYIYAIKMEPSMETKRLIALQISKLTMPLSDRALKKLASILVLIELKKGELFLREGEVCKHMGYIQKGMVRVFYYKNNKEITEYFAYEDKFFVSIESCFRQKPSAMIIEALEPTTVYGLPYDELITLGREDVEISEFTRTLLEISLIISQNKTDSLRFETANERYTRLMKDDPEIIKRAPLSYIASYLLMTPETLSRVRANIL